MRKEMKKTALLPDYAVYAMPWSEKGMVFIFGLAAVFGAVFLLFSQVLPAFLVAVPAAFLLQKPACRLRRERRKRKLLLQFRDYLDSMRGSFSAGKNLTEAMEDTYSDLSRLHGEKELIVREAAGMREKVRNGMRPEDALIEFAARSDLDDIRTFADTVKACAENGGNLGQTVNNCREILTERMAAEQEIAAALSATRIELYVLACVPFAAALLLRVMGGGILQESTPIGIASRAVAAVLFLCAVLLGRSISRVSV